MTDHDKNQLLEAILGDDELAQLRQGSLARGFKEMRRRRHRALAARTALMALPVVLLALIVFHPRPQAPAPARATAPIASKVEYITADQLFALFPNRSMALVGKPGHQQVIFGDELLVNSP
jgi:hypothetical protein